MAEKQPQQSGAEDAIEHLRQAIAQGKHWYIALLEAIGLWTLPEETHNGRYYRYLIAGEAFDWLLLAERLCQEVDSLVPEQEKDNLLFFGQPPLALSKDEFKGLIGNTKYRAYLNYLYGVIVEQALIFAVEEEIYKEHQADIGRRGGGDFEDSYQRIYGADQLTLLQRFRTEKGYPQGDTITLTELREFTYWLFKYRLQNCDKARVASDTKKGLRQLERQQRLKAFLASSEGESVIDV